MAQQRLALPPGPYKIQANVVNGRYIKNAAIDGAALSLTTTVDGSCEWMILGDGTIRNIETKIKYAWANLDSGVVPQALTRSGTAAKWIISALAWNAAGYYTGQICSSVDARLCTKADEDNNSVVLHARRGNDEKWRFIPI